MPSYTTWTRLEPRTRDAELTDGLRAAVRDPLWLLGRQWQTGELRGEDGGSPVDVDVELAVDRMARGRPGGVSDPAADTVFGDGDPPLETLVEREPLRPAGGDRDVRLAAEAGSHFHRLLGTEFSVSTADFPDSLVLSGAESDAETARYSSVVAGRTLDGDAVYDHYDFETLGAFEAAVTGASPPPLPAGLALDDADARRSFWRAIDAYREWYDSRYTAAEDGTDAWDAQRQEYNYRVSTGSGTAETVLAAEAYEGGRLDWYDFRADPSGSLEPSDWTGPDREHHRPPHGTDQSPPDGREPLVPSPSTFEGMPAERWWEFEDDGVDFSAVEGAPEDLSRALMLQFALVYGNDWFTMPVDLPVGSLSQVDTLDVTTTFGERVSVESAAVSDDDPTTDWNMYGVPLGDDARGLFLAPTLVDALESDPVEAVEFARDEGANLAWAIEDTVEGAIGQALDRTEAVAGTGKAAPVATADGTDVAYQLASSVPENWFPLVARRGGSLDRVTLHLGRLLTDDPPVPEPTGALLSDTLAVPEEEVSRTGHTVERRFALTRWADGEAHLWGGRAVGVGSGGTDSGLSFDNLVDPRAGAADDAIGEPEPFPDGEPVAPDDAPATARLELARARFETPGGARENLDMETVTLLNASSEPLDIGGWSVGDAAGARYTVESGTTLAPGGELTLHTGDGTDTDGDRYWGRDQAVWNDAGDTVHVFDASGDLVLIRRVPEQPPDVAGRSLVLAAVVADPDGPATEERLVFENTSGGPLSIAGWTVEDAAGHAYRFPSGAQLPAGGSATLHTGVGDDGRSDFYWGRGSAVWNNDGDTVSVFDDSGAVVLRHSY